MIVEKEYQLTFTESEVNDVLTGIGNYFSYIKAKPLIAKIGEQLKKADEKAESEHPTMKTVKSKK